ncbi:MAG: RidA family protein [Oceanisphaera sp.]|uniref:RidA family protein n=1 Tax=Oceanisphaera sp. TaxID=1929979 RepID=UPI003C760796
MTIERVRTTKRSSPILRHNGTVYLTGQVGEGATVAEQTHSCLARIDALLAEVGTDKSHLLQATIWLSDMGDYDVFNEVWDSWVPEGTAPVRSCGEVSVAKPEYRVEVIIIAAMPNS